MPFVAEGIEATMLLISFYLKHQEFGYCCSEGMLLMMTPTARKALSQSRRKAKCLNIIVHNAAGVICG